MSRTSSAILGTLSFVFFRLKLVLLWQFVPSSIRRRIVAGFIKVPERRPRVDRPLSSAPPFTILGFASSEVGLGWVTRMLARQLSMSAGPATVFDITERFGTAHYGSTVREQPFPTEPGTLVLNVNPHQIALSLAGIPAEAIDNKYTVGAFAWELEAIPDAWHAPLALIDEIWAPSKFVAAAFERAGFKGPIRVVPHPVEVPEGTQARRADFNLPDDRFLVLVAANTRSGVARKNVEGAIQAFLEAFPNEDHKALLVLKIHDPAFGERIPDRLKEALGRSDIRIVEEGFDDNTMWDFIASCDAVLSMHRSEGYGILLKQGLLLGKPVVATGWSGNVDFMTGEPNGYLVDYDLVPVNDPEGVYDSRQGLVWAEPRTEHAAELLGNLYQDWLKRQGSSC